MLLAVEAVSEQAVVVSLLPGTPAVVSLEQQEQLALLF